MGRAATAVPTKGERTRRHLLEVAERVFGEKGFYEASVADITREAGVANGTFYVHFPSKVDVFTELIRVRGREMRASMAAATSGLTDRAEIERAGLKAFLDWIRDHPQIYRIVKNAEFVDPSLFRDWYVQIADGYTDSLAKSMRRGEIPKGHAEALAYCLMAVGDFAGMRWILWEDGKPVPARVQDTILAFLLRGLGAGKTA